MSRSRELVAEAKKVMEKAMYSSLQGLSGDWFLFTKEGQPTFIEWADHDGYLGGDAANGSFDQMVADGWTVEAVLIYKVTADK